MRSEERLETALRRTDLPWPDEAGAYERFLRRHARRAYVRAGVALAALVAAAATAFGVLPDRDRPRPAAGGPTPTTLSPRESRFMPPSFHPDGNAVVVAEGERDGIPWRLAAVPGREQPPGRGRSFRVLCMQLAHPVSGDGSTGGSSCDEERLPVVTGYNTWGDGTELIVYGAVPPAATQVRLEVPYQRDLPLQPSVAVQTSAVQLGRRFYVGFVPSDQGVRRVVALGARGREVAKGGGVVADTSALSPSGPRAEVARIRSSDGLVRLVAFRKGARDCMNLAIGNSRTTDCDKPTTGHRSDEDLWDYMATCGIKSSLVYGIASPNTRTIRFSAPGVRPFDVPARPGPAGFSHRAWYLAELTGPIGKLKAGTVNGRMTALDAAGREIASAKWQGACAG
jgi:hypothetical protein